MKKTKKQQPTKRLAPTAPTEPAQTAARSPDPMIRFQRSIEDMVADAEGMAKLKPCAKNDAVVIALKYVWDALERAQKP